MEVTLIDGGIGRLQSPNFLPHLSELAGISFWTWGALVLAAIATFTSLVRRTRSLILHLRLVRTLRSTPTPTTTPLFEYDSDGDETCSSCSSGEESDDGEVDDEEEEEAVSRGWRWSFSDDLWVGGWGLDVVKAWGEDSDTEEEEEEGLALSFASSPPASLLSLWDRSSMSARSLPADQIEAIREAAPRLTVSPGRGIRVWDARVGGDVPAVIATQWHKPGLRRRVSEVATRGDWEVVYLNGDGGAGSVVDLRKPGEKLATVAADETWWDAE